MLLLIFSAALWITTTMELHNHGVSATTSLWIPGRTRIGSYFEHLQDTDYYDYYDNVTYSVVCAFNSLSVYRPGKGRFKPEDIDPHLCTDIFYDYAKIDDRSLLLAPMDLGADINIQNLYQRTVGLKKLNPELRVHLSVGGWEESATGKFSRLVSDPLAMDHFAHHASSFLSKHGFDGLNVAWFYPSCSAGDCSVVSGTNDKENFVKLLQELRKAFDRLDPPLLLSATVSGDVDVIEKAYDVPALGRLLDRIDVMTYDYATFRDGRTDFSAPIFPPRYRFSNKTVDSAIRYWMRSVPQGKLLLGIPTYGQSFTLTDPLKYGTRSPVRGPGRKSEYYHEQGKLAFYEICEKIKQGGWNVQGGGPAGVFAYSGDQWVSFDNLNEVTNKVDYIKLMRLGGATVWDVSTDDFNATCCQTRFPLLSIVSSELRDQGDDFVDC